MLLETKWIIGLLILMAIGSLLASFVAPLDSSCQNGTTVQDFFTQCKALGNAFSSVNILGYANVFYQAGETFLVFVKAFATMILWNFCFFKGFEWLQYILIVINIAIFVKLIFDVARAMKPFGG